MAERFDLLQPIEGLGMEVTNFVAPERRLPVVGPADFVGHLLHPTTQRLLDLANVYHEETIIGSSVVFDDFIADAILSRYEQLLRICWDAVLSLSSPSFLPFSAQQLLFLAGKNGVTFTKELLRHLLTLYRLLEESRVKILPIDHHGRFEARLRFLEIYANISSGEEIAHELEASLLVHALVYLDSNSAVIEAK